MAILHALKCGSKPKVRRQVRSRVRPRLEQLEARLALNIDFDDGIISVTGTPARDYITAEINPDDDDEILVTVRAWDGLVPGNVLEQEDFDIDDVEYIFMSGLGSGDFLGNATAVASTLTGGLGNDVLLGGGADDQLVGGAGGDLYLFDNSAASIDIAYQFSDVFFTNLGHDTIDDAPELSRHTLNFSALDVGISINLRRTTTQIVAPGVLELTLTRADSIDDVIGTPQDDVILGNARNNTLLGDEGDDLLAGDAGDDSLSGGPDDDTYSFANVSSTSNLIVSQQGRDEVIESAGGGADTLDFSAMVDATGAGIGMRIDLASTAEQDVNFATAMTPFRLNLQLLGGDFENVVGTWFNDTIIGNALGNRLRGLGGRDHLEGRAGDDVLEGGLGSDTYRFRNAAGANLGHDHVIEITNSGTDLLSFNGLDRGITLDLALTGRQTVAAGVLDLTLNQGQAQNPLVAAIEKVVGTSLADTIFGNSLGNILNGGDGGDTLVGRRGKDKLFGGRGVDFLNPDFDNQTSDGFHDELYTNTAADRTDGAADTYVVYWRRRNGRWIQEEILSVENIDFRQDVFQP
jgi:Ca2+-binding RTX toxin-like protein